MLDSDDQQIPLPEWIEFDSVSQILIVDSPTDESLIGEYKIGLTASLDDSKSTQTQEWFKLTISEKDCVPLDFSYFIVEDLELTVGDEAVEIILQTDYAPCESKYTVTHSIIGPEFV